MFLRVGSCLVLFCIPTCSGKKKKTIKHLLTDLFLQMFNEEVDVFEMFVRRQKEKSLSSCNFNFAEYEGTFQSVHP